MKILKTILTASVMLSASIGHINATNNTNQTNSGKPTVTKRPFSLTSLQKTMKDQEGDNFNLNDFVYLLIDVDKDGQSELFIKEKVKNYNTYYAFTLNSKGEVNLVMSRSSGGYEDFSYTEDGYLYHYEEHTGGMSQCSTYYKLNKSKVIQTSIYSSYQETTGEGEDMDMNIEESYSVEKNGSVLSEKEEDYTKSIAKKPRISLYDLTGWKNF